MCYEFFKQIRTKFGNKLIIIIFTAGAQWYTILVDVLKI